MTEQITAEEFAKIEAGQADFDRFYNTLRTVYDDLMVNDPQYAYAASRMTAAELARKMTCGLAAGTADKDGKAIRLTCRELGIKHTYRAIRAYLCKP